jgi:hypothetical protein
MTAEQVSLVRATWRGVQPIADAAAALFYERLVTLEPGLRPLVARTDMAKQRQKLLQALGAVVASADRLHVLTGTLEELGRRHAAARAARAGWRRSAAGSLEPARRCAAGLERIWNLLRPDQRSRSGSSTVPALNDPPGAAAHSRRSALFPPDC